MSEIYLARHQDPSGAAHDVVIKRLLPELGSDPEFMKMFLDEAQIALRLRHANVVHVIRPLFFKNESLLVMEFVRGASMAALLRHARKTGSPVPFDVAASIGAQIAAGLHHAHELRDRDGNPMEVVHRDVSPGNILVSYDGVAKILDFGVARALGRLSHTGARIAKGTPSYMAPEQLAHTRIDRRTDIFGLGVVLWEAATNERLFPGAKERTGHHNSLSDPIVPPNSLANVPPELGAIIMRALDRNPDQRFQTAEEMSLALAAYATASGASLARVAAFVRGLNTAGTLTWQADSGSTPATLAFKKQTPPPPPAPRSSPPSLPASLPLPSPSPSAPGEGDDGLEIIEVEVVEARRLGRLGFWSLTALACFASAALMMGVLHRPLRNALWPEQREGVDGAGAASSGVEAAPAGPEIGPVGGTAAGSATAGSAVAGSPVISPIRSGQPSPAAPGAPPPVESAADRSRTVAPAVSTSDSKPASTKHRRAGTRRRSRKSSTSAEHKSSSSSLWKSGLVITSWKKP